MRNINDFNGGKEQIMLNNNEEYLLLMPILNTRWENWKTSTLIGQKFPCYIVFEYGLDGISSVRKEGKTIIQASEYYTEQEANALIFN